MKHSAVLGFLPLLVLAGACATTPFLDPRYYELLSQPAPQSLPVPVAGVAKGRLWDSYGDPRSGGRQHEGIDIFAKRNTPAGILGCSNNRSLSRSTPKAPAQARQSRRELKAKHRSTLRPGPVTRETSSPLRSA